MSSSLRRRRTLLRRCATGKLTCASRSATTAAAAACATYDPLPPAGRQGEGAEAGTYSSSLGMRTLRSRASCSCACAWSAGGFGCVSAHRQAWAFNASLLPTDMAAFTFSAASKAEAKRRGRGGAGYRRYKVFFGMRFLLSVR